MINDTPVLFADAEPLPRDVIGRPNGDIWVNNYGSNLGLGRVRHYDASGQLLSRMNIFNAGLPDYFVDGLKCDSSGNMWFVGSNGGGISRMLGCNGAPEAATHWRNWSRHNDGAEPNPWGDNDGMYSVFEDADGIFWMGGTGVGRWNSVTGEFTNFWNWQNSNLDSSGMQVLVKRQGTMWVGTGGSGVSWLNGNNWTRVLLDPNWNYDANHVNAMTVDTANNLWVGSNYGLRKFAPGNNSTFTLYNTSNCPLPGNYIIALMADPSGGIWIGGDGGLVRFDGTNWTFYNQGNTGMPGNVVHGIARRSSDGLIAVATQQGFTWPYTGGVSTFNGTTWKHYTPQNSPLIHWQIEAVEFDANGNLWATDGSEGVVQIMIGNQPQALQMLTAVSRKTHGAAGTFDINLPFSGNPGVECRSSGGNYTLVFTFTNNVVSGNANISSGTGTIVGTPTFSANTMTMNLSGVANVQTLTVHLSNVTDQFSQVMAEAMVAVKFLVGDTNGNGTVNASDVGQTKSQVGQTTSATNFRCDLNANGAVNASDVGLVKSHVGTSAP